MHARAHTRTNAHTHTHARARAHTDAHTNTHTHTHTNTHTHTQLAGRKIPRGEICMRGKNVMMGYLKLESETAAVLSSDGWLRTGDIGQWNVDGCV